MPAREAIMIAQLAGGRGGENLALRPRLPTLDTAMTVPRRSERFVSRSVGGETFVVPVRAGIADLESIFTMNEVGTAIWTRIDGTKTVDELARALAAEFDVTEVDAGADVAAFIDLLASKGLVEEAEGSK
jgi:hypothetical protein